LFPDLQKSLVLLGLWRCINGYPAVPAIAATELAARTGVTRNDHPIADGVGQPQHIGHPGLQLTLAFIH